MGRQWLHAKRAIVNLKKGQAVQKLVKEITVAAKLGGGDPEGNARLFAAVEKARKASVTRDVIQRAINKGAGIGGDSASLEHVVYEGYAPHKVPVIVEVMTDNHNRSSADLRALFRKGVLGGGKFSLSDPGVRHALRDAVLGKGVLLLIGAMVIGSLCGKRGMESVEGFFVTPFQGVLALFLLEMGMVAGRRLSDLKKVGVFLLLFGVTAPLVHGFAGVLLGGWVGLSVGGATLLGVLAASASYIAAPAAVRLSVPEANPTFSLTAALAITFPFNISLGIPLFYEAAKLLHA